MKRETKGGKRQTPSGKRKSAWTVYILRCADGSLYTGITRDVARRVREHNGSGTPGARYTRSRRPVVLAYQEPAPSRSTASKREYRIKQLARSAKLALLAKGKGKRGKEKV